MSEDSLRESQILASWRANARPWVYAVREEKIQSRKLVTNRAIIDAILGVQPRSVLDVGCGEGWLVRELGARSVHAVGIDGVPRLVKEATSAGGGAYHTLAYEQLASGPFECPFDAIVCNFSLLGKESVESVFMAAPSLLNAHGNLVVQTLHSVEACGDRPYQDGWREGSWDGFGEEFSDPAPWYFRTLETWVGLFEDNGFRLREVREPSYSATAKPASIIFVGELKNQRPSNAG